MDARNDTVGGSIALWQGSRLPMARSGMARPIHTTNCRDYGV